MATVIKNLPAYLSNDADFRTWGKGISDELAAAGLVQTADTGQINWTTVTKPAGSNTAAGYEIRRFDDALQSSAPVFVKVEYGTGGAADRPAVWITVGNASNGAGTLTGQVSTRTQSAPGASKTAGATLNAYFCCATGRMLFAFSLDPSASSFGCMVDVERPRDQNGAAQADAIFVLLQANASRGYQLIPQAGSVPSLASVFPFVNPGGGAVSAAGAEVCLTSAVVCFGQAFTVLGLLAYVHADIGELTSFTADFLGATHTFLPLGDGLSVAGFGVQSPVPAFAMLWE
jgi:hypothetical protein